VDVESPEKDHKPSAKIVPFLARQAHSPYESILGDAINTTAFRDIITSAIDDSVWVKTLQEDREALEEEKAFRRRFGFIVNRTRRQKVLKLKHTADLTDREIRMLWWTYNLDLNPDHARITATNLLQAWGYIQIGTFCLLMLQGFWMAINAESRTLSHLVMLAIVELVLALLLGGADWLYVRPNQIRQRIIREGKA
jgi:hypothetical protein